MLQIFDFTLKIDYEMGLGVETGAACPRKFALIRRHAKICLLLQDELVNELLFANHFAFDDLHARSQPRILVLQTVRCHALLHHVIVQTFSFLHDKPGSQLAHFQVNKRGSLGRHGLLLGPSCPLQTCRRNAPSIQLLAKIELCFSAGCPGTAFPTTNSPCLLCCSQKERLRVKVTGCLLLAEEGLLGEARLLVLVHVVRMLAWVHPATHRHLLLLLLEHLLVLELCGLHL